MTRDEIYDHLAQVYIGKKNKIDKEKKRQFNAWLLINIVITVVIFVGAFYGFTAFLTQKNGDLHNRIIYSLSRGPIRLSYNLDYPYPPVKSFALATPQINAGKYQALQFSVRGMDEGWPGVMRVEVRNARNEKASVLIDGVNLDWNKHKILFEDFKEITDWSSVSEVSFIIESWNAEKKHGIVLIDDICFSS